MWRRSAPSSISACIRRAGAHLGDVETFIKDPRAVVKPGDVVKVKVLEVEIERKRIALTLRLDDEPGAKSERPARDMPRDNSGRCIGCAQPQHSGIVARHVARRTLAFGPRFVIESQGQRDALALDFDSSTFTLTTSPGFTTARGSLMKVFDIAEMCTSPS